MARDYQVWGEASLASGTAGGGALEELGISVDGVTITTDEMWDDVFMDTFGSKTPVDRQLMLYEYTITADLIYYDIVVLAKWLAQNTGGGATFGTYPAAGLLAVRNNVCARLLVRSTPANTGLAGAPFCWNFPKAIIIDAQEIKVGVRDNPWRVKWKAMPSFATSSTQGVVVMNSTCT